MSTDDCVEQNTRAEREREREKKLFCCNIWKKSHISFWESILQCKIVTMDEIIRGCAYWKWTEAIVVRTQIDSFFVLFTYSISFQYKFSFSLFFLCLEKISDFILTQCIRLIYRITFNPYVLSHFDSITVSGWRNHATKKNVVNE